MGVRGGVYAVGGDMSGGMFAWRGLGVLIERGMVGRGGGGGCRLGRDMGSRTEKRVNGQVRGRVG